MARDFFPHLYKVRPPIISWSINPIINYSYIPIWRFPQMGVPLNHPFDFRIFHEINHPTFWGTPIYGNPYLGGLTYCRPKRSEKPPVVADFHPRPGVPPVAPMMNGAAAMRWGRRKGNHSGCWGKIWQNAGKYGKLWENPENIEILQYLIT